MNCLKLTEEGELHVIRGELSHPKICIVLKVLAAARGTHSDHLNAESLLGR
ncbi:hypothetical protein PCANC_26443 [Puccinia coronata f. sp. avenae]|uniref:Uncharacterized protein n=1 Tax=Puccinia coronata f. sp. avenae TaxID=200324 RepID=A0A2N5TRC3_9BASI|nr:hypothetical protein PCANC_26443 [Puccinia coronata f. sp. avenae]